MTEFVPYKAEEQISAIITRREAVLLQKLRAQSFGKVVVHKANNLITRIEFTDSLLVDESIEVNLILNNK